MSDTNHKKLMICLKIEEEIRNVQRSPTQIDATILLGGRDAL